MHDVVGLACEALLAELGLNVVDLACDALLEAAQLLAELLLEAAKLLAEEFKLGSDRNVLTSEGEMGRSQLGRSRSLLWRMKC